MSWQLLFAVSTISVTVGVLLQRVLLKREKSHPIAYAIVFQLLVGIFTGIFALIHGFKIPNLHPILPNILFMPICYGIYYILRFKSLKIIDISEFSIILGARSIVTILIAIIFLKESFSLIRLLGACILIASVFMLYWEKKQFRVNTGAVYAVISAIALAVGVANDAFILRTFDAATYEAVSAILTAFAIIIISPKAVFFIRDMFEKDIVMKMSVSTITYAFGQVALFLAYQIGRNIAQISSLFALNTILYVLCGIVFLKEKNNIKRKLLATGISVVGVILVLR